MKIFVDTNIFLDLILKREKFHDALLIFNAIEKKLFEGIILDITILNIDYIAKKQVKNITILSILDLSKSNQITLFKYSSINACGLNAATSLVKWITRR